MHKIVYLGLLTVTPACLGVALNPLLANIIGNNGGDGVLILNQSNSKPVKIMT